MNQKLSEMKILLRPQKHQLLATGLAKQAFKVLQLIQVLTLRISARHFLRWRHVLRTLLGVV